MKTLYHVQRRRFTTTVLLFASCALLVLLAACGPPAVGSHATTSGTSSVTAPATHASTFGTSSVTASVTTEPMPPTQTSCPANGQGRPAVTAPLALGNQQTVVYVDTSSSKSTLKSYTLSTGQTTTLTSVPVSFQVALVDAQVSTDGHYVLFITGRELQMIRMDGQGLQTLYCYPQRTGVPDTLMNLLWSPNQQLAVFEEPSVYGGPAGPTVRLLNLGNGSVQTIAQSGEHVAIQLEAWLGNTQVYYTIYAPPLAQLYNNVYALNVTEPVEKNSTEIAPIQGNLWDMNLTPDNRTLILSQCADILNFGASGQQNESLPPSLITAQPARGGTLRPIYVSHVHAVVQTRLSNQAMLFVIEDSAYIEGPQDGLWKINLDGTGLTLLMRGHTVLAGTRTTWANVSRDGMFYAAVNHTLQGASVSTEVYVGPFNGGTPKRFIATNDTIAIAGWTTR
jgi:hypothetical protein